MSKTEFKKYIAHLDADALRSMLLEAYSARKETKEYFDFFLNPDSGRKAEKYRDIIYREFVSRQGYMKRHPRRSVCKRAIRDFLRFSPDPEVAVQLMLYYVGLADKWIRATARGSTEMFADSVAESFVEAMNMIKREWLTDKYRQAVEDIIANSEKWHGTQYGFLCEQWRQVLAADSFGNPERGQ